MKKIGILTQPLISNYGGILQNFALQYVLKEHGYDVETINRMRNDGSLRIFLAKLKRKLLRTNLGIILSKSEQKIITKYSRKFIDSYIRRIDVVNPTDKELLELCVKQNYNTVIVGSDQVWRPMYSCNVYNDFFNFLSDKNITKISYAASFGTNDWEFSDEQTLICKKLIKNFKAVSVREDSAVIKCKEKFDIDAKLVLDPTLLLDKSVYLTIISNNEQDLNKGIYTYVLDRNGVKGEMIEKVSSLLNKKVFFNQPLKHQSDVLISDSYNIMDLVYPPVEGWLQGFRDADFIITDSFHGTVFSIIFNKPFLSIVNEGRGKTRFLSLLSLFGLENRLISDIEEIDDILIRGEIDYKRVNQVLIEKRNESLKFLLENV